MRCRGAAAPPLHLDSPTGIARTKNAAKGSDPRGALEVQVTRYRLRPGRMRPSLDSDDTLADSPHSAPPKTPRPITRPACTLGSGGSVARLQAATNPYEWRDSTAQITTTQVAAFGGAIGHHSMSPFRNRDKCPPPSAKNAREIPKLPKRPRICRGRGRRGAPFPGGRGQRYIPELSPPPFAPLRSLSLRCWPKTSSPA